MAEMKRLFTALQDKGLTAEEIAEYQELRRMKARSEKERQEKELPDS